jgi:hypothetical protein
MRQRRLKVETMRTRIQAQLVRSSACYISDAIQETWADWLTFNKAQDGPENAILKVFNSAPNFGNGFPRGDRR